MVIVRDNRVELVRDEDNSVRKPQGKRDDRRQIEKFKIPFSHLDALKAQKKWKMRTTGTLMPHAVTEPSPLTSFQ